MKDKGLPVVAFILLLLVLLQFSPALPAQVPGFTAPDSVYTNQPFTITNTSTGGSSWYWNFCPGNLHNDPAGTNTGNPGNLLNVPTYSTLVTDGGECFTFISNQGTQSVIRYDHGSNFSNPPMNTVNLGTFGVLSDDVEGIQIKQEGSTWIGFVCNYDQLVRLNFGTSLKNIPTATVIGPVTELEMAHGFLLISENGTWTGLITCTDGNRLVRLHFGNSLLNTPTFENLGTVGGLNSPGQTAHITDNGNNYIFAVNLPNSTISRLDFGNSISNMPTGVNLGAVGSQAMGITLLRDCGSIHGFVTRYLNSSTSGDLLWKITFPAGITGPMAAQSLGNIGALERPCLFSELFREGDNLFTYISNRGNGTRTLLTFASCTNASPPSSNAFNPPPVSYNAPGIYNIRLVVNEGLPTEASVCKTIVVRDPPANPVADFTLPDTVCTGTPVTITNLSAGGTSYYWNFCSGNTLADPVGTNIGNPGNLLDVPVYITLAKDAGKCYSFITNRGTTSVIRYNHGSSFSNNPVAWTDLGSYGMINDSLLGLKVCNDNGQWIGFVCNNNRIVRLNFGASPGNTPTATILGPYAMLYSAHCLDLVKEGSTWVGYLTCSLGNKLVRLNFGNSLLNAPVLTDLGVPGALNLPGPFRLVKESGQWSALVVNMGNNTLTRLTFGASLLNNPAGVNLGTVCPSINPGGISLVSDCEGTTGFQLNYSSTSSDLIWRLSLPSGISGPVTGLSLGNIGNLNRPAHFSELFRAGDTLFLYATNRDNGTLTRLRFLPCANASAPSSTLFNPPVYSYDQPGTYNVRLTVNEGLPNQAVVCKNIVVKSCPVTVTADFTLPDTICAGTAVTIENKTTGGSTWYWNFCTGNTLADPQGVNIGNPGSLLNVPGYITLVKDGSTCYSFVTTHGSSRIVQYNHGTSFSNNPVSWNNLDIFGMISDTVQGIRIRNDNGTWVGLVNDNNRLVRLNFGSSLANVPAATILGPYAMYWASHGLEILKEGDTWIGFLACTVGNKFIRLNFGNSLLNNPVLADLGLPGGMNMPSSFCLVAEAGNWYALVVNYAGNTLTRLSFGNSLLNSPTGENLGNVCPGITATGIAVVRDCENTTGFQLNGSSSSPDLLWRLNFPAGITGPVTGTSLGNIGQMNRPLRFSELYRDGDTLFLYATNRDDGTLTRLRFLPCTNASAPSSPLFTPPAYTYNQPGTYNVQLTVNEGMPDQASLCKVITVVPKPSDSLIDTTLCYGTPWHAGGAWQTQPGIYLDTVHMAGNCDSIVHTTLRYKPEIAVSLGRDTMKCEDPPIILRTGVQAAGYLWQDSSTDSTFTVFDPGSYWVTVTKYGCSAGDTIRVKPCVSPLWFPNVFTPNGDGVNDTFHPVGIGVLTYNILVYDRWGRNIYESDSPEPGWDGTLNGALCSDGVYVFIATYKMDDASGETYKAKGTVVVLR